MGWNRHKMLYNYRFGFAIKRLKVKFSNQRRKLCNISQLIFKLKIIFNFNLFIYRFKYKTNIFIKWKARVFHDYGFEVVTCDYWFSILEASVAKRVLAGPAVIDLPSIRPEISDIYYCRVLKIVTLNAL